MNGENPPEEGPEETNDDRDALQFVLQETRTLLLQQILAHESGALSVEELVYRNPELSEENIRYHLRELVKRGIVTGLEIPTGERRRDIPNTFYAVTERGIHLLRQANLFEEIAVWKQVYEQMERTDRIAEIEAIDTRPTAAWYDDIEPVTEEEDTAVTVDSDSEFTVSKSPADTEPVGDVTSVPASGARPGSWELPDTERERGESTSITVVGCGNAGTNIVEALHEIGMVNATLTAVDTKANQLEETSADKRILIGEERTQGRGAGSLPEVGEEAAQENEEKIRDTIQESDFLIVTAGLGGGTGTGAAPVVAEAAHENDIYTLSIVTVPFTAEGEVRRRNAENGLERLEAVSDAVIVVPYDEILESLEDVRVAAVFEHADEFLAQGIRSLIEHLIGQGAATIDSSDFQTILQEGRFASIGYDEGSADESVADVVNSAINSTIFTADPSNIESALISIAGGPELTIAEAERGVEELYDLISSNARIIWSTASDEALAGTVQVVIVATRTDSPSISTSGEADGSSENPLDEADLSEDS